MRRAGASFPLFLKSEFPKRKRHPDSIRSSVLAVCFMRLFSVLSPFFRFCRSSLLSGCGRAPCPLRLISQRGVFCAIGHPRRGALAAEMEIGRQGVANRPFAGAVAERKDRRASKRRIAARFRGFNTAVLDRRGATRELETMNLSDNRIARDAKNGPNFGSGFSLRPQLPQFGNPCLIRPCRFLRHLANASP